MKRLGLFLLTVLLLTGCNTNKDAEPAAEQYTMPEEMPGDFDFFVRYGYD